jgi:hypothetical protein
MPRELRDRVLTLISVFSRFLRMFSVRHIACSFERSNGVGALRTLLKFLIILALTPTL